METIHGIILFLIQSNPVTDIESYHSQTDLDQLKAPLRYFAVIICYCVSLPQVSSAPSPSLKLDTSAPLFPHIPALFYVLHLLYQELQLDELQRARASSLVCLLQQLARYEEERSEESCSHRAQGL